MSPVHPQTSPREPSSTLAAFVFSSRRPTTITLPPFLNTRDATALPIPLVPPITISFLPRKFNSMMLAASIGPWRIGSQTSGSTLVLQHKQILSLKPWPAVVGYAVVLPGQEKELPASTSR